eukprot:TRINITY_DN3915_c0_g1_i1.p1 TRINITY_DN3915_c0_g1~~TRINITY_DN3915_c0_g1_i1.p1  ORF type:complete len:179 (+),score=36.64 TRINITY_DN3915_c0_g1_i1:701-1237(+)
MSRCRAGRRRVVWDEDNLHLIETHKTAHQKITEPKTPYHAPDNDGMNSPMPYDLEGSVMEVQAEAIREALTEVASGSNNNDSLSANNSEWASSEDEGDEMDHDLSGSESVENGKRRLSFEEQRRKHYDEYRKVKELVAQGKRIDDDDEDSGENGKENGPAPERATWHSVKEGAVGTTG